MTADSPRHLFNELCGVVATVHFCHRRADLAHLMIALNSRHADDRRAGHDSK